MATKEMEVATASYRTDMSAVRFDNAWEAAKARIKGFDIGANPPNKINFDPWAKLMVGSKKDVVVKIVLVDQKTIRIVATSGGKTADGYETYLSAGNATLWRGEMAKLAAKAPMLVSAGDLAAFNTAHPDPEVVKQLKKELDDLKKARDKLKTDLDAKQAEVDKKQKDYTAAGGK